MKKALFLLVVMVLLAGFAPGCGEESATTTTVSTMEAYQPQFQAPASSTGLVFQSPELQFQLLRALGASAYGAADIGECLVTAMQVNEAELSQGNFDSWYNAWYSMAERLNGIAAETLARGDKTGARDTYLRCNTYYNMSEFYLHGNASDPRIADASGKARTCFREAGKLMNPPVEEVGIKYGDVTLPGYFYRVDTGSEKRPLVIIQTGFDGTQEELYAGGASAALERGFNALTFEGPGQGAVLREQGLHFTPEWGNVVTSVVDYAVSRKDVDSKKIALWGISMGGCLAARAAAYEPRLSALILDPAMDMEQVVVRSFGPMLEEMAAMSGDTGFKADAASIKAAIEQDPNDMDEAFEYAMTTSVSLTWFVQNGMYVFGVDRPSGFPLALLDYSLDGITENIKCDTLVCDAEQDVQKYGSMTKDIYDSLTCPKDYVLFTNAEGAGAHCQIGASRFGALVKLGWLEEKFGTVK